MQFILQYLDLNIYFNYSFQVISFVLMAIGLFMMAKKLQLTNAWVAFIPIGQIYVLGKIIGVLPLRRKIHPSAATRLLTFELITYALTYIGTILMALSVGEFFLAGFINGVVIPTDTDLINAPLLMFSGLFAITGAVFAIISLVYRIFAYIRLFKLFDPRNYVLFTVLGVLFPFLAGIFMIIVSKYNPQEYLNTVPQQQQPYQDVYGNR